MTTLFAESSPCTPQRSNLATRSSIDNQAYYSSSVSHDPIGYVHLVMG